MNLLFWPAWNKKVWIVLFVSTLGFLYQEFQISHAFSA